MGRIADRHEEDIGLGREQHVEVGRRVPPIADLADFPLLHPLADGIVVRLRAAHRDQSIRRADRCQQRLAAPVIDGDTLHRRAHHDRTGKIAGQCRRLDASGHEHDAHPLFRAIRRAAPGDDIGVQIDDPVPIPFDYAERSGVGDRDRATDGGCLGRLIAAPGKQSDQQHNQPTHQKLVLTVARTCRGVDGVAKVGCVSVPK